MLVIQETELNRPWTGKFYKPEKALQVALVGVAKREYFKSSGSGRMPCLHR